MRLNYVMCRDFVFGREGDKYHHVSGDMGGPTSAYGVTLATAKSLGLDVDHDGDVDVQDLKQLTWDDVDTVFRKYFWDSINGDELPGGIDLIAVDIAWNMGPGRFKQFLLEGHAGTPEALTKRRKLYYREIVSKKPTQIKFLNGWLKRAELALEKSAECEV